MNWNDKRKNLIRAHNLLAEIVDADIDNAKDKRAYDAVGRAMTKCQIECEDLGIKPSKIEVK